MQIGSAYLAVQPSAVDEGQEELRAVGVRSCIRHAEHTFTLVLDKKKGRMNALDRLDRGWTEMNR